MTKPSIGLLVLAFANACGGGGGDDPVDAAPLPDAGPPGVPRFDEGDRRGRVQLLELRGVLVEVATAMGAFAETATPARIVFYGPMAVFHTHRETMREGNCRLLQSMPAFCDACVGSCVADDVCEPFPVYASAGTLAIDGLRDGPLALSPTENVPWYRDGGDLAGDLFADDAAIEVSASGAAVGGFTLATTGVPRLETEHGDDGPLVLDGGGDVAVRWEAALPDDPEVRVRLVLNSNNPGHGQPYRGVIECDAADVGELAIPAALAAAFPDTLDFGAVPCGGTDCPASHLTRYRRAATDVGGTVDLVVASQRQFYVAKGPQP